VTYVLLYHDVVQPADRDAVGFPGAVAARYKLSPELFEAHLEAIAEAGVGIGLVDPAAAAPAAAFSFDDAGASALTAAEALERRDWRGHFFVPTERLGTPGFLDPSEVRDLAHRGHEIGSHSHTHPRYMGRLPRERVLEEWRRSRGILAEVLGWEPVSASVPGGSLSRAVIECAAEAGYRVLMTSEPTARVRSDDGLLRVGRYGIWATTSPTRAAAYVRGARRPRARLWLEWNGKTLARRANSRLYERLRELRTASGPRQ
jgi:peptidoglycan/xylan/chitin deacetylase (PgdA/CDA1 family)